MPDVKEIIGSIINGNMMPITNAVSSSPMQAATSSSAFHTGGAPVDNDTYKGAPGWDDLMQQLGAYKGSGVQAGAGRYKSDPNFALGDYKSIRELEGSENYRNFTDYVLANPDNYRVRSYLRALDASTPGGVPKMFNGENLSANWADTYKRLRTDGLGGAYHFSGDMSKIIPHVAAAQAVAEQKPAAEQISEEARLRKNVEDREKAERTRYQEMLDAHKKSVEKDRTDAIRMAAFNSLGNALSAMVQPIGWGIGGATSKAIPPDDRAYLESFQRALKANDDLRNIGLKDMNVQMDFARRDTQKAQAELDKYLKDEEARRRMDEAKKPDYEARKADAIKAWYLHGAPNGISLDKWLNLSGYGEDYFGGWKPSGVEIAAIERGSGNKVSKGSKGTKGGEKKATVPTEILKSGDFRAYQAYRVAQNNAKKEAEAKKREQEKKEWLKDTSRKPETKKIGW